MIPIPKAIQKLLNVFLSTPSETPLDLRREILSYAQDPDHYPADHIPDIWRIYLDKVIRHAYKVTDADIQRLKDAGFSEGYIYEVTAAATLGTGLRRLTAGLNAINTAHDINA